MAYGNFKYGIVWLMNLRRRTASDKVLRDKAFNIPKSQKYDGYQKGLAWYIQQVVWLHMLCQRL